MQNALGIKSSLVLIYNNYKCINIDLKVTNLLKFYKKKNSKQNYKGTIERKLRIIKTQKLQ